MQLNVKLYHTNGSNEHFSWRKGNQTIWPQKCTRCPRNINITLLIVNWTLALIGMLFYRTSIWNEGITCSRQLENIVGTVALWDVWFILLWYRVSSLETIDKIWTVRWKFVIITDSQYETTDRNGQLNSKVKLQNYLIFSLNCIDAYLSLQCICTGDNILLFFLSCLFVR